MQIKRWMRTLISLVMAVMMVMPNVAQVRADVKSDTIVAQGNNMCPQDGSSCFNTPGIKVREISVSANGEVQIHGHVDFPAVLEYQVVGGDPAGGSGLINDGESGDFTETFGPFEAGTIFKFHIKEDGSSDPELFPSYPVNEGPYVEEFGYRVYITEHTVPLDVGQGAYDWTDSSGILHTGDQIYLSFLHGYFRNLSAGRALGSPKHMPGNQYGAVVQEFEGYLIQFFTGNGGSVYEGMLIYNHNRCKTFAVVNGIFDTYLTHTPGPHGWLGAPVSDEYIRGGPEDEFEYLYIGFSEWTYWLQRFEHGFISSKDGIHYDDYKYHPTGGNIDLYVYTTDEDKGRVYLSLKIISVPGLPDDEPVDVYITGEAEGEMWPMTRGADGRYYGAYGVDLEFGDSINLSILIRRSNDSAAGVAPRDQYGIDIPIERGYVRNGIDLLPADLISDLNCSIPEEGGVVRIINIQGRVYDGIEDSSYSHPSDAPLIDIEVELWRNGSKVGSDITDENGEYVFSNVVFADGYEVRFPLQNASNPAFEIRYGSQVQRGSDKHCGKHVYEGITAGDIVYITKVLDLSDPQTGIISLQDDYSMLSALPVELDSQKDRLDDLGAIYVHARQAIEFFGDATGVRFPLRIHGFANDPEYENGDIAFFVPEEGQNFSNILFAWGASDYQDGSRPDNREWHEISHAFMYHSIGISEDESNSCNHNGYKNISTGDSWVEGWAEFWSMAIADSLGDTQANLYRVNDTNYNLEHNYQVWDGAYTSQKILDMEFPKWTSTEEFAVAGLMWDIVDPTGLEWWEPYKCYGVFVGGNCRGVWGRDTSISRDDKVDLEVSRLWEIIRDGNTLNGLDNIYELHQAFAEYAGSDYELSDNIDDLFIVHGFFRDGDGANADRQYQDNELVGYGGRVDGDGRFFAPVTAKTSLQLNVVNSEGDIIKKGTVSVHVLHNFPLDIYDFDYTLELATLPANNLIWLEPPLTGVGTAVEIQVEVEGQTSGILRIDDWAFWLGVANSKAGYGFDYLHNYLGEYTFILGDPTPIPFDYTPPQALILQGAVHGNNNWLLTDPVNITFTAVDALVGIAKIEYSLNATDWLTYTEPFTATHGDTIYYRATDWLNNVEPTQQVTIQIDTGLPTSEVALSPNLPYSETFTTDVTVSLSGTDTGPSGLDHIEYRLNGGAWLHYDVVNPPVITQNGPNILDYRAVDVAGNVESAHRITLTLDKTVHTIIPLDATQTNRMAAIRILMDAFWNGQTPLMAAEAFTITEGYGTWMVSTFYPAGTMIFPGEVAGDFTRKVHIGPLDVSPAWVLYPQMPVIFNSASADERASWEQLEIGVVLEDTLNRPDWPRVDEVALVSDTLPSDVFFIPAGVTADVQTIFAESGAAAALLAQVQAGKWVVCQGDGCLLAQQAGLVPDGTLTAGATLPAGASALAAVEQGAILSYNWPDGMKLARYNDTPRFTLSGDLIRVADYADNGEAAIVLRRVGAGGVILIGGHASANTSTYGLLYHALFTAGAEQIGSQVSVEQQFMPGIPPEVLPGLEPEMPVLVRTTLTYHGAGPVSNFRYTELITAGFHLVAPPTVTVGTVTVTPLTETQGTVILPAGTLVLWTAELLPPGAHELRYQVANVTTDTLKPGEVTLSTADFSYTVGAAITRPVQASRPDAVVRALLPPLVVHNPTDEPDNTYPLPATGFYRHIREDLENKLETRANNTFYTVTIPGIDIVRDAFDQTIFPTIKHYGWYRPIVITDVEETHAFVVNTVSGYPDRNYLIPVGAAGQDWSYSLKDWDGHTWVRIPNPRHTFVHIPIEYRAFIIQEPGNGDLLVPGITLTFNLGTLLAYDSREPVIRYLIHSQELFGRGISFGVEPVTDTLVLEGNGGSVYTAVGQHPIPFREYFPEAAINNPIAPITSEIGYTDLWGRAHTVTETVRSSFYDIIPYPKTGDAVGTRVIDVYGLQGEEGGALYDVAAAQTLTVTYVVKAKSINRSLTPQQFILQKLLPRGLGYDIELLSWESGNGSFVLLDEYSLQFPAFELLSFQGALPANTAEVLTITARLRTYPDHRREGSFLVDGGSRFGAPVEVGGPGQYDTGMTHVRVEQGYAADPAVVKRVAEAQVPRQGGLAHELIYLNSTADIQRYWEETYVDSVGTLAEAATVRVGGSRGKQLYFATVRPGGETLLVYEITNASGEDWHNVALTYVAPPGITLTPIFTAGVEPPPNVYDTPYLWAAEIPDISRGVYYYKVQVAGDVAPGVMYPIVFTLAGTNVPDAAAFPLPVARVGVGGEVQYILGQTTAAQVVDTSPAYVTPVAAALATAAQLAATENYTVTEQWAGFFATLTQTVPFTYSLLPDATRRITYTLPAGWETLPQQRGTDLLGEMFLLVQTAITATEPGYRLVNYGPQLAGQDNFHVPLTVRGNPGYTTISGPALTGTYTLLTTTSPFYGGVVIEPLPGEIVDAWVDIAIRNLGNRPAQTPEISATVNLSGGIEILAVVPAPTSVISGVITWQLPTLLPYGGVGSEEQDVAHVQVQLRFTPPDAAEIRARLARLENSPFYVPLLNDSVARYTYTWGPQTYEVRSALGAAYGLRVGSDPLPAPNLYRATWDGDRKRVLLNWTGVSGARDYVVYRSTGLDRDFQQVGWVTSGTAMENRIYDDPPALVYYYVIRARNAAWVEGRHSQVVAVYTQLHFMMYLPLVVRNQ